MWLLSARRRTARSRLPFWSSSKRSPSSKLFLGVFEEPPRLGCDLFDRRVWHQLEASDCRRRGSRTAESRRRSVNSSRHAPHWRLRIPFGGCSRRHGHDGCNRLIGTRACHLSFLKTLSAREMLAAMIARVTQRTELGPRRALPTAHIPSRYWGPALCYALGECGSASLRHGLHLSGISGLRGNHHLHRHPEFDRTTLCVTGPRNQRSRALSRNARCLSFCSVVELGPWMFLTRFG